MTTITITTSTLRQLVEPIIPLAGKDDSLPVLTGVQVRSKGKWLTAAATDRFRLGIKRVAPEGEQWPAFEALIPARVLKTILTTFKAARGLEPELTLTIEQDKLIVAAAGELFSGMVDARAAFYLLQGQFPAVESLVRDAINAKIATEPQAFNWGYLADFRHAQDRHGSGLALKPTVRGEKAGKEKAGPLVIAGDDFIGVLMPRVLFDATSGVELGADWLDLLEPAKAAAVRA